MSDFARTLLAAGNAISEGLDRDARTSALNNAQSRRDKIQAQDIDEAERRLQLQNSANQLSVDLLKTGAPTSQVKTAAGAVGPSAALTGVQRLAEAFASGSNKAKKVADEQLHAEKTFEARQGSLDRITGLAKTLITAKSKDAAFPVTGTEVAKSIQRFIPEKLQDNAFKEAGHLETIQKSVTEIDAIFLAQEGVGIGATIPFTAKKAALEVANANILNLTAAAVKGNPSEKEFEKQLEPFTIAASDTDAQAEEKRKGLMQFIKINAPATPLLKQFKIPIARFKKAADVTADDLISIPEGSRQDFLKQFPQEKQTELINSVLWKSEASKSGR